MSDSKRKVWVKGMALGVSVAMLAGAMSGCGKTETKEDSTKADKVSVRLIFSPTPDSSYFWVGVEKGFFKDEGIDLSIKAPTQPGDALKTVGMSRDQFGVAYPEDVLLAAEKGSELVAVGAIIPKNITGIASYEEKNIKTPKDLVGKTVGLINIPTTQKRWESMLEEAKIDPSTITTVDTNFASVEMLLAGKIDGAATLASVENTIVQTESGKKVSMMFFADNGSPQGYGQLLITNKKLVKDDPDLVKRFSRATFKSIQYCIDNPKEAADIFSKKNPESNTKANKMTLDMMTDFWQSDITKKKGLGWQEKSNWSELQDWMIKKGMLTKKADVTELFTNDYLK